MGLNFTIKERSSELKDYVIEQIGHAHTFTLGELENNKEVFEKLKKEIQGNAMLQKAKMENIETNHPFVKNLSDQDLFTAHMYQEAKNSFLLLNKKMQEVIDAEKEQNEDMEEMYKQIPEIAPVPSTLHE